MRMIDNKTDVIQCSNCDLNWEIARGDRKFKSCQWCREKARDEYRNRSAEVVQTNPSTARHKFYTNEAWRLQKNADVPSLLKSTVVCSECDKVMNYGHKKCNRGRRQKITLEMILELAVEVCPLVESQDRDCLIF